MPKKSWFAKRKSNAPLRRLGAFTLLEVMVAVAIAMLALLAAGMCVFAVRKSWTGVQTRETELKRLVGIDNVVNSRFRNAIPFSWPGNGKSHREVFLGNPDKIVITSLGRVNVPSEGALRFLSLELDNGALVARHSPYPILYWQEDSNAPAVTEEVLSDKVARLTFQYGKRGYAGKIEWIDDWDEERSLGIPAAIKMVIEWEDGSRAQWLTRTAGAGLSSTFGRGI